MLDKKEEKLPAAENIRRTPALGLASREASSSKERPLPIPSRRAAPRSGELPAWSMEASSQAGSLRMPPGSKLNEHEKSLVNTWLAKEIELKGFL